MERKEIDKKYKWDLSAIYESDRAFFSDYTECEHLIKDYKIHEKTINKSAKGLLSALKDKTDIERKIEKLWCYAHLAFCVDTSDNEAQAKSTKVRDLAVKADSATWFVSPYIMRIDEKALLGWFKEESTLNSYKREIEKIIAQKPHMLSDDCEKLISKMGNCLGTQEEIRGIFANSDLQFGKIKDENGKTVQITDANYVTMLMNSNRKVRRAAFMCVYKTYEQFANTFATFYSTAVKEKCTIAKIRGYKNSITASTFRDEVTPVIYNSLIKSVHNSMNAIYEYFDLKREVLGLDKIHMYDMYAPLITSKSNKTYTYEEAVEDVLDAVKVFGDEYYSTLKSGLTERGWVDVYPSKGKRSGAFSAGSYDTEPYILTNFNGTYDNISTLAHEAGHSMHSYFSRKYNEPQNSGYTIFVAEVASTVNELLMAHKKLRESDNDIDRLYILNQLMETYKGTLFRQTMFAEFERDMHALSEKGVPLTADVLNSSYKKLINRYFGPRVVKDKQISYEWMRIPHFYYEFYVYKYATCISAASAIVKRIETEGEAYVEKYIDFLKCGDSKSPLDSLKVAGIDMTDPNVVRGAIEDFESAIHQFKEIYEKNNK